VKSEKVNSSAKAISDADERRHRRDRDIAEYIREEPLTSLAIAGGVGFIFGGGARSRIGLALLTTVGRIALSGAVTSFVVGLVDGNRDNQNADRAKARRESHRNGNHDNGRTDFGDSD
jgi:hypothetical protein